MTQIQSKKKFFKKSKFSSLSKTYTDNRLIMGNIRPQEMKYGMATKVTKEIGYTDCGCQAGFRPGLVLDPFIGSGTTALVARSLGRSYVGIELKPDYLEIAEKRLAKMTQPIKAAAGARK